MDLMQGNVLSFAERRNRVVRKALRRPSNKKVNHVLKRGARNRKRAPAAKKSAKKRAPAAKRSAKRAFSKRLWNARKKQVKKSRSFIQRKAAKVHKLKKTLKKPSKKPSKKHLKNKVVKRVIKKANKLKQMKKSTP